MTEQKSPSPAAASSKPDTPKGARAVCSIAVDAITVPSERLRKLRPEVVDWLNGAPVIHTACTVNFGAG